MKKKLSLCTRLTAALLLALAAVSCTSAPPDLTGVTSYYVKDSGSDKNSGVSEDAPFKTLAKAITQAATTPVKTITVIGTLTTACDEIKDLTSDGEILITGKTGEAAVKPEKGNGLMITGSLKIRLDRIVFTGSGRISAIKGAAITLGKGAKVTGIMGYHYGGGVFIDGGTLVMEEDAEISGNRGGLGGGVCAANGTQVIMKGNAVIKENETLTWLDNNQRNGGYGGGITLQNGSSLVMQDNASISGNKAFREWVMDGGGGPRGGGFGGGIHVIDSTVTLQDNTTIINNTAGILGGGIYLDGGSLVMKNKSAIQGNKADGFVLASAGGGALADVVPNIPEGKPGTGGGVAAHEAATLTMEDESSIKNNEAAQVGGGLYLSEDVVFTQNTGTVSGNTATEDGADIYWVQ